MTRQRSRQPAGQQSEKTEGQKRGWASRPWPILVVEILGIWALVVAILAGIALLIGALGSIGDDGRQFETTWDRVDRIWQAHQRGQ